MNPCARATRFLQFICAILSLVRLLEAYDLTTEQETGPLGIQLDLSIARSWPANAPLEDNTVAQKQRSWVYASHIKFNEKTDIEHISDKQFTQLAFDAFKEMDSMVTKYGANKGKTMPGVMTALAFDKDIIFTSSQRGPTSFSYGSPTDPNTPELRPENHRVRMYLDLCQQAHLQETGDDKQHRIGGSCGEQMAANAYFRLYPGTDLSSYKDSRITTVIKAAGVSNGGYRAIPPCATIDEGQTPPERKVCQVFPPHDTISVC